MCRLLHKRRYWVFDSMSDSRHPITNVCRRHTECACYTVHHVALPLLMAAILVCSACGRDSRPKPLAEAPLREIDAPALDRLLEKHRGKVVLVDFWATWCGPCVEMLPHTVELQNRFRDRGLVVVTVSLDDPDNESAVRRLLGRHGATTENYLARYGVGPEAFAAFRFEDGALPHLRLYDRQGNLLRTFAAGDAPIDPREVERAIEKMLPRLECRSPSR